MRALPYLSPPGPGSPPTTPVTTPSTCSPSFSRPGFEDFMRDTSAREGEKHFPLSQAEQDAVEKKYSHAVIISERALSRPQPHDCSRAGQVTTTTSSCCTNAERGECAVYSSGLPGRHRSPSPMEYVRDEGG